MTVERRKPLTAKVGIVGVGHKIYWEQFPGLLDNLMGFMDDFEEKVKGYEVSTVNYGMIDNAESTYETLKKIKSSDIDLLFVDMLTYATSATWGIIIRELDIPIVLIALQPLAAMDYSVATTQMQLENDNICSLPEFAGVAVRMGKKVPPMIIGQLYNDEEAWAEVSRWCQIAKVLHDLKGARIGHMGHVLEAMLDMHSDPTAFTAHFGLHIVQTEPDDVVIQYRNASKEEVEKKKEEILDFFETPEPKSDPITRKLTDDDLETAARVAVALDKFIQEKKLDGLAYYYEGDPSTDLHKVVTNFIVGNSMLTGAGFPMCGESDIKTLIGMLIMDRLDIGGSFAEFHPIDFNNDYVLVGHDGPHHINIAQGKPVLRSLIKYHGKPGSGASVEFQIKHGPITMLSVSMTNEGKFKFVITEGESGEGAIPPTGNTNTRGIFKPDTKTFLQNWLKEGPTHHFALGIGHHAQSIKDIADILGIEAVIVE